MSQSAAAAQVWLVTGSSTGIGWAVVGAALEAGHRVVAASRRIGDLEALKQTHGDALLPVHVDLTQPAQVERMVARTVAAFQRIDVLVNSAGFRVDGALEEQSEAQIDEQVALNLTGALKLTRSVLPHMRRQRFGRILLISSLFGQMGAAGWSVYAATKWGVEGFAECLAVEVAHFGIHVTIVEPGSFRTERRGVIEVQVQIDEYAQTAGKARLARLSRVGKQRGDPTRAARVILKLAAADHPPFRVALGTDSFPQVTQAMAKRLADLTAVESLSRETDYE